MIAVNIMPLKSRMKVLWNTKKFRRITKDKFVEGVDYMIQDTLIIEVGYERYFYYFQLL